MIISCSCCGANYEFKYSAENVLNAVSILGWGSYGAALYCPECTSTWLEQYGDARVVSVAEDVPEQLRLGDTL